MGFSPEDIVTSDQTHTTNIRTVVWEDRGNGITKPRPYKDIDGMVTMFLEWFLLLFMRIVFLCTS